MHSVKKCKKGKHKWVEVAFVFASWYECETCGIHKDNVHD